MSKPSCRLCPRSTYFLSGFQGSALELLEPLSLTSARPEAGRQAGQMATPRHVPGEGP